MNQLVPIAAHAPALVRTAGERAQTRFWEFFVSNIRNPHTRRAYGRSIAEFLAWCEQHGLASIVDVEPLHVGTYYAMIPRRAMAAGIATKIGNHSFRATGITTYLKNGGTLEGAASMASHAST